MKLELFAAAMAFCFGAAAGSFLNVCIYRLPRRCMSIDRPRGSVCPVCRTPIKARHNLPILSWMLLGGRCAACNVRIPIRYPGVELLVALLFAVAAALRVNSGEFAALAFDIYLISAVVTLSFVDIDLRIIPDEISFTAVPIGVLAALIAPTKLLLAHTIAPFGNPRLDAGLAAILGALAGGGGLYALGWLGSLIFRKPAMGLGDVKILAGLGAFTGWAGCLGGVLVGMGVAAVLAGIRFARTRSHHIAFGPYLGFGVLAVRLLDVRAEAMALRAADWMSRPENLTTVFAGVGLLIAYLIVFLIALLRDGQKGTGKS